VADYMPVFALTAPDEKSKGVTAFILDAHQPGFNRGKSERKLGIRAAATCEIEFADCRCPV
jgi:alkylation response protein AidB-like acyl-CoA dehydrogenase